MIARAGEGMIAAYRAAGHIAAPLVAALLSRRASRGKEDPVRLGERHGLASRPRPEGPLVWIHAASVGETNAVVPLVERIVAAGPSVLFTTVTVTGAEVAALKLPPRAIHQFAPVDISPWIDRFLGHWHPDLALFVESELWPGIIAALAAAGTPQILVNGRLSENSFRRWKRMGALAAPLFSHLALCLAQGAGDAERYRAVGVGNVAVTGNLKFDVAPPAADPQKLAAIRTAIGSRPVWIAASTHEGEEAVIGDVQADLRARVPGALAVIVPRHPERGPAIRGMLQAKGLAAALRSDGEPIVPETEIYVADTLGELGLFYRLAPVAFLGGSLIPHGGQNPIEPAQLDSALLHGPHVANFAEIYAALDRSGGAETVADGPVLAAALGRLLRDPAETSRRAEAAAAALAPFCGGLERTMAALAPYLAPFPVRLPVGAA